MVEPSLQIGQAKLIFSSERMTSVFIKVLNAGNVRVGTNKEDLQNNPLEGIPITSALQFQTLLGWLGDLWLISDAAGTQVVVIAPGYQYYQSRGKRLGQPNDVVKTPGEADGKLNSY